MPETGGRETPTLPEEEAVFPSPTSHASPGETTQFAERSGPNLLALVENPCQPVHQPFGQVIPVMPGRFVEVDPPPPGFSFR